jgi:hypothetical protein
MNGSYDVTSETIVTIFLRVGIQLGKEEAETLASAASPFLQSLEELWQVEVNQLEPAVAFVPEG